MAKILNNPKARHDYHIDETFEAGIALQGIEVKSLRAGRGSIREAFVRVTDNEVFLHNAHIEEYSQGNRENHETRRTRKLLLHAREIAKIFATTQQKGFTCVATSLYWKGNHIKCEIVLAKGKETHDKRATERERDWKRDKQRILKQSA